MRKALYWVLVGIFGLIFLISAYIVVDYFIESRQSEDTWEDIQDMFDEDATAGSSDGIGSTGGVIVKPTPGQTNRPTQGTTQPVPSTPLLTDPIIPGTTVPIGGETNPTIPGTTVPTGPDGTTIPEIPETTIPPTTIPNTTVTTPPVPTVPTVPETTGPKTILSRFKNLYKLNNDVVGYIRIVNDPDLPTDHKKHYLINYPILHHPSEKDYYINRNFYEQLDKNGSIYLREACDMFKPTDVLTIYGHNMSNGSMFAGLHKYLTKSYFNSHQYITIWDLYAEHTYQVVCVFRTSGTYGVGFPFHLFDDFEDEDEYNEFINGVRDLAIYDTGIETQYGDQFVCLCTCEYTINNGRLILVAKRIS